MAQDGQDQDSMARMPAAIRTRGWVRALLAVSLALNLAIAGLWAGIWLGQEPEHPQNSGGRRDGGLGPLANAMRGEDWRAMRADWDSRNPDLRRGHEQLRADYDPLITALRAEPFDPDRMQAALTGISHSNSRRLISATEVIGAYLARLSEAERKDYAARLEVAVAPRRKKD